MPPTRIQLYSCTAVAQGEVRGWPLAVAAWLVVGGWLYPGLRVLNFPTQVTGCALRVQVAASLAVAALVAAQWNPI